MAATHRLDSIRSARPVLYLAFELSSNQWKVPSTTPHVVKSLVLSRFPPPNQDQVLREISRARKQFDLPRNARVVSCYEAGRDGLWLDRFLHQFGVHNLVVESSSIEVNRRLRRAKADNLDAVSLVRRHSRYCEGDEKVWSVVTVPGADDKDHRQPHRELNQLRLQHNASAISAGCDCDF